jgi:splicing factor U2AF subunit
MADHLARIFGTEEDKVNCPFYYKIGACRHGERCSRTHMRPTFSQTVLIPHLYQALPPGPDGQPVDDKEHFEDFYEEILEELSKYGEIEQLHVVENLGDHMFGNIYVKYHTEEEAEACCNALRGRYYGGRLVMPEYSPVSDFREARCRQFDEEHCARGGYCNFMHLKHVPRELRRLLHKLASKMRRKRKYGSSKSRSRSKSKEKGRRSRSRSPGGGGGGDKDKKRSDKESNKERSGRDRDRDRGDKKDKDSLARSGSAERRAKIAQWNQARDNKKDDKKEETTSSSSNSSGGGDKHDEKHGKERSASPLN